MKDRTPILLWLTDSPGFGGAEKTLMRAIGYLRDRIRCVLAHGQAVCPEIEKWLAETGVESVAIRTGNRLVNAPAVIVSITKLIFRYPGAIFVIWAHHSDSSRWQQLALLALGRRYLISERLIPVSRNAFSASKLSIPIKRWTSGGAEAVVLNAYSQVGPFRHVFGIAGRNLRVIANSRPVWAIANAVAELRRNRIELRRKWNLGESPVVLCLARLAGQKDQRSLIQSCYQIRTPLTLVLFGEGEDQAELETFSKKLTHHRVVFAGHQSDALPWLAAADLFVLPSLAEGLPGSLIEAMAAGLPCIATDIPGNRELVIDGVTGLSIPIRSPDRLASALERLLGDPELASRLARAGIEHVAAHYDETAEKAAWQGLADEHCGSSRSNRC